LVEIHIIPRIYVEPIYKSVGPVYISTRRIECEKQYTKTTQVLCLC